ncbi:MAG: hypothetical protein ACSHXW_04755, partial [Yoonia sp.]
MAKQFQTRRSSMAEAGKEFQKISTVHQAISYRSETRSGRDFAARKTAWHIQVTSDGGVPTSAYRVAMLLPKWLNAKSEEAFPSQGTVARELNLTVRAVTNAFRLLVARGHLSVKPGKRGYHGTNIYKMEVHETEIVNSCSPSQASSAKLVNKYSPQPRTNVPRDAEQTFGQTIEETNKRTNHRDDPSHSANQAGIGSSEPRERVSQEVVQRIMRETFGEKALNKQGVRRQGFWDQERPNLRESLAHLFGV